MSIFRTDARTDGETLNPDPAPPTHAQEEICAVRGGAGPPASLQQIEYLLIEINLLDESSTFVFRNPAPRNKRFHKDSFLNYYRKSSQSTVCEVFESRKPLLFFTFK